MNNTLKAKFHANQFTLGSWISIGHPAIAEILASAGFDWLVVDLEHSTISIREAGDLIRVIDLCGVVALVRLTANDPSQVKRMLDAGAHGIIVPMVNSADDAACAVAATRYAPRGNRGVGLARAQKYGTGFQDYLRWQEADGPIVIAQIEHQLGVEQLERIVAVPGVDAVIVGPYDLSCSMGIPGQFEEPEFTAATTRILRVGRRAGCPVGLHLVEPDPERMPGLLAEGYGFVAFSVDFRMLDVAARAGVARFKEGAR